MFWRAKYYSQLPSSGSELFEYSIIQKGAIGSGNPAVLSYDQWNNCSWRIQVPYFLNDQYEPEWTGTPIFVSEGTGPQSVSVEIDSDAEIVDVEVWMDMDHTFLSDLQVTISHGGVNVILFEDLKYSL